MSKASEWAAIEHDPPRYAGDTVTAEVNYRGDCVLDEVGGDRRTWIDAHGALALGRWLVETFGEAST